MIAGLANAQEAAPPAGGTSLCVFRNADLSEEKGAGAFQDIINDQIDRELEGAGFMIIPRPSLQELQGRERLSDRDLVGSQAALRLARELKADLALTGFHFIREGELILGFKCYDVIQGRIAAATLMTAPLDVALYNLVGRALSELIPQMRPGLSPPRLSLLAQELSLVSTDEGMEVALKDGAALGVIQGGRLVVSTLPVPLGSKIVVIKRKEGFHPDEEILSITASRSEIVLRPLTRQTRFASELHWSAGQLWGFGLAHRFYLEPDWLFLAGEYYPFHQSSFQDIHDPVTRHDLRVLLGGYLQMGPRSPLRLGASSGLGLELTRFPDPDLPGYGDPYLNLLNLWLEVNLGEWAVFLRGEGRYGMGISGSALGRNWLLPDDPLPPLGLGVFRKW